MLWLLVSGRVPYKSFGESKTTIRLSLGCSGKLGSMVSKWLIGYLLINGVYWGYNPLILTFYELLEHPSRCAGRWRTPSDRVVVLGDPRGIRVNSTNGSEEKWPIDLGVRIPSREVTYTTLGKGQASKLTHQKVWLVPRRVYTWRSISFE